jgi:hypothetical protein
VPVTSMYAARPNAVQAALEEKEQVRFRRGELDPQRLYILLGKCPPPVALGRLRQLDGVWIIPPMAQQALVNDVPVVPAFHLGETYSLDDTSSLRCYLDDNWSLPPGESVQNRVEHAGIDLPLSRVQPRDLALTLGIKGLLRKNRLVVSANGQVVYNQIIDKARHDFRIVLPANVVKTGRLELDITVKKDGAAPRARDDARGIKLYTLRLE